MFSSTEVAKLTHFGFKIIDIPTAFIYDTSQANEYYLNLIWWDFNHACSYFLAISEYFYL